MTIVKRSSIEELKQLFAETLINKTDKVNKISDNSVLNAIAFGNAKVGQKVLKEIALIESINFPDSAVGAMLDLIAEKNGIAPRFTASQSSTLILVVATPGTVYTSGTNNFRTNGGITFELESNLTIGASGFSYAKVRSVSTGSRNNVNPLSINEVFPEPAGHQYVINEYRALGGRDIEDDATFRQRIKEGPNVAAKGTLAMLAQVFNKINPNVLRVFYYGIDELGRPILGIATQNGADLTNQELDALLEQGEKFFNLTEIRPFGIEQYKVKLQNVVYQPIDVDFRVDLLQNFDPDQVRIEIQTRFAKLIDYRFWQEGGKVEWDDLLEVAKNTPGVKYVPDQKFKPGQDIQIELGKLPRFRSFAMRDLQGTLIIDNSGNLNPIFYPFQPNQTIRETFLNDITNA